MSAIEFWDLIDSAKKSVEKAVAVPAWLTGHLQNQSIEFLKEFDEQLQRSFAQAYDARLWAAATVLMGFCSDDKFTDFRGWLIAQGKQTFDRVLEDPEWLAELPANDGDDGRPVLFYMQSVAVKVYRQKVGNPFADIPHPKQKVQLLNENIWAEYRNDPQKLFPRLASKYHR